MSILGFLFLVFVIYLGYRLLFDFILPVYRTTRRVRKGFREMHERMNQQAQPYQQEASGRQNQSNDKKGGPGEYIDFEEIKD